MPRTLLDEIAVFDEHRSRLEREHDGEWVVVTGGQIVGCYEREQDTFAVFDAYPTGQPILVRRIGFTPAPMPRVTFATVDAH